MTNNFIIQPMASNDAEALQNLLRLQLEEELSLFARPQLLNHFQTSDATIKRLIDHWLVSPSVEVFIAIRASTPIAFVAAQYKNDIYNNLDVVSGEVLALYVNNNFRRQGLGKILMNAAQTWLVSHQVHAINVSWLEGNEASRTLYQKSGFEAVYSTGRKLLPRD